MTLYNNTHKDGCEAIVSFVGSLLLLILLFSCVEKTRGKMVNRDCLDVMGNLEQM